MRFDYSKLPKKRVIGLVLLLTFFVNFDSSVVIPIIANYAMSLGASYFLAGIIVGAYSIVHIPSNIALGRVVDKIGRKVPLILGLCFDGTSLILYSFAKDPMMLLFARLLHGVGGGFGGPATMAYLADLIPESKSGRGMAFYGISVAFSMLFGFIIGGIVVHFLGYSTLFISVGTALFLMAALSFILPSTYVPPAIKLSFKQELTVIKKVIFRKVMLYPYLSIFVLNFNLSVITTVFSVILKSLGYTHAQIGMMFATMVLFSIIFHYPSGVIGDKLGKEKIIATGLTITAVSFVFLSFFTDYSYFIAGVIILGIGHGMTFPTAAGLVRDYTSEENRGIATGVFYGLVVAGFAIGAPLVGLIVELTSEFIGMSTGIIAPLLSLAFLSLLRNKGLNEHK